MEKLKACPFCGGNHTKASFKRKHIRYNGYGNYLEWCSASVRCTKCHARGSIVSGDVFHGVLHEGEKMPEGTTTEAALKKEAIEAWNRRAENEELEFTRGFIHDNGLDFALASAWKRYVNEVSE